jgi:hypothetical protein
MARMASRPKYCRVIYRGIPYILDLVICRRALVNRQVEGELDSMESLAGALGISRSTVSRFFSGRPTSLAVTLKILGALGVTFRDVAKPAADDDDGATGAVGSPRPSGSAGPTSQAAA